MIDTKARKKIIKLYEQGESKASIQRQTGITQPTIRKVLQEAGLDRTIITKESETDFTYLKDRVERLEEQLEALMFTPIMNNKGQLVQPPQGAFANTMPPVDVFIVNTTRAWPSRGTPLFQALRNGIPHWRLDAVLSPIYYPNIVKSIVDQIDYLGRYGIFQITVSHKKIGDEDVSVLLLEGDF